jgi:hypothetical protein
MWSKYIIGIHENGTIKPIPSTIRTH